VFLLLNVYAFLEARYHLLFLKNIFLLLRKYFLLLRNDFLHPGNLFLQIKNYFPAPGKHFLGPRNVFLPVRNDFLGVRNYLLVLENDFLLLRNLSHTGIDTLQSKGISLRQLTVLTGMAKSALSEIENGRRNSYLLTLKQIADTLKVDVKDFL